MYNEDESEDDEALPPTESLLEVCRALAMGPPSDGTIDEVPKETFRPDAFDHEALFKLLAGARRQGPSKPEALEIQRRFTPKRRKKGPEIPNSIETALRNHMKSNVLSGHSIQGPQGLGHLPRPMARQHQEVPPKRPLRHFLKRLPCGSRRSVNPLLLSTSHFRHRGHSLRPTGRPWKHGCI